MLDYAWKLTAHPVDMDAADVKALRDAGFDDTGILDICQVTAYYNYVNRLADGLGVELEEHWSEQDMIMTPDEFAHRTGRRPHGESCE